MGGPLGGSGAAPVAQARYPEETNWDKLMIEAARGHGNPVPQLR